MPPEEAKKTESEEQSKKTETETKASDKQFSQEDLNAKIDERLKREREASDKKLADELAKAKADWERQSKLSQEEKDKEARERVAKELAEKENSLALRENRADARETLQERGISDKLVDFLVTPDKEQTTKNIDAFEQAYKDAVKEGVDKALAGKTLEEKPKPKEDGKTDTHTLLFGKK